MSKSKNIGTITLCGLIVGPVLGSGIVLLPPLAYKLIGKWAIPAWIIIMLLGIIFAYVFVFLSLKSPGNKGVAIAIGNAFGNFFRELTSNFLTAAVCFGPTAVLITAAGFLKSFSFFSNIKVEMIAFGMEIICALILICGVKALTKFTLILTGLTAVLLLSGIIYTLIFASNVHTPETSFSFSKFGYTLLLLFWAIMTPLFGSFSLPIITIAASGMCTYLMIVGGVSRMSAKRASNNKLPFYLSYVNKNGSPINAIITLVCIHLVVLSLAAANFLSLDKIVTCANVFFLSNAIVGLAAGFKLLHNIKLKIAISILIVSFTLLLFKAALWSLSLLIIVVLLSIYNNKRLNKQKVPNFCG